MSTTHRSFLIYGVRIPIDKIEKWEHQRLCNHPELPVKFCPECGREMWKNVKVAGIDEFENELPSWFTIATTGYDARDVFVGIGHEANEEKPINLFSDIYALPKLEKDICAYLKPLKLWFPERFKMWLIHYVN